MVKLKRKVKYKDFLFEIDKLKYGYGVRVFKNSKPLVVSSGHQQFIGMGKTRVEAIKDAKDTIDKYGAKW